MLRLIEQRRNGDTIDQGLVKEDVDSFVSLGLDESNINKASLVVHKEHFEIAFLDTTGKYYKLESESFLAQSVSRTTSGRQETGFVKRRT